MVVAFVAAVVLVALDVSIATLFVVAGLLGLFWGWLVYIRFRRPDPQHEPAPHDTGQHPTSDRSQVPPVRA